MFCTPLRQLTSSSTDPKRQEGGANIPIKKEQTAKMASLVTYGQQTKQYIARAQSLPGPLLRFLARYPPKQIRDPDQPKTHFQQERPNPFLSTVHPITGRRHEPVYSLRRQADLVKKARKFGIEELLPYTPKKTEIKLAKKVKFGSRVKGTGVGQRVKGHKHERDLGSKYVVEATWAVARRRSTTGNKVVSWADLETQDGKEERGHAQHAGAHQRMESGTSELHSRLGTSLYANGLCRLAGRTGRGGPPKWQACVEIILRVQTGIEIQYQISKFKNRQRLEFLFNPGNVTGCSPVVCVTAEHSASGIESWASLALPSRGPT